MSRMVSNCNALITDVSSMNFPLLVNSKLISVEVTHFKSGSATSLSIIDLISDPAMPCTDFVAVNAAILSPAVTSLYK